MKTINATKGELVELTNALFAVQDLEGKEFALIVSKNIRNLQKCLKDVEESSKPSPEFMEIAKEINDIANKNPDNAKEQIDRIEEDNLELVNQRRTQVAETAEKLKEEASVEIKYLTEEMLPEDITAKQLKGLLKIID